MLIVARTASSWVLLRRPDILFIFLFDTNFHTKYEEMHQKYECSL